jgi:hypothetical protein
VKALVALIVVGALVTGGALLWLSPDDPDGGGGTGGAQGEAVDPSGTEGELTGSACRRLAGVTARLAERDLSALELLRSLGSQVAGIRPPPRAIGDLARGGRDLLPGRGFLARYDDGSSGQARHFAGIAVATTIVGGGGLTRFISERFRDDPRGSADGRLTGAGIEFATELRDGDLSLDEAPAWVLKNLCRRR